MKQSSGIIMLTLCALIWGTAFIAQSVGAQYVGPLTFNFSRSILASLFLFPCIFLFDALAGKKLSLWGTEDNAARHRLLRGGIICGLILTADSLVQQIGMAYTTVGKGGFITSLYIIIVPILGRCFFGRTVHFQQWVSVLLASIGMYFICLSGVVSVNKGDLYILVSAFCFAIHILSVEYFAQDVDGVRFSFLQFLACTVANGLLMFIFENPTTEQINLALIPILYAGIMSSGIAYTLQILGQAKVNAVLSSMLLSLESVFAVLSGWLILNQVLTLRELFGCCLVFSAIILAQLPPKYFGSRSQS